MTIKQWTLAAIVGTVILTGCTKKPPPPPPPEPVAPIVETAPEPEVAAPAVDTVAERRARIEARMG